MAVTVRPALVVPMPVVRTARGLRRVANLRNWDLPVPATAKSLSEPTVFRWQRESVSTRIADEEHVRLAADLQAELVCVCDATDHDQCEGQLHCAE
jgi:hypothetical protein